MMDSWLSMSRRTQNLADLVQQADRDTRILWEQEHRGRKAQDQIKKVTVYSDEIQQT